ncbi:MAG: SDR family NAD(P)-dependent oxidoreductase, partial [Alphaproteobacteria bacterium]|nr:SDR family NAD(P)-dependent oxidoreductase [Alphaproteobacteria bacterium]
MNFGLEGKVALVTGGARDVGAEIAMALAGEGATVAINYRGSEAEAAALAETITTGGGQARAWQADVTDYGAVRGMIEGIVEEFGR